MKLTALRIRIKEWSHARRFNFFAYNSILTIVLCIILSFTPFSLEGSYLPVLLADLSLSWIVYDFLIKPGKRNNPGKKVADDIELSIK